MEAHGRTVQSYAQKQADLGLRLAREIEERQRSGQALDDEEIQALEEELETIAEEAAPHYEELERQVEELTRQLEPTREQMRTLSVELRREVDAWRSRHAALLRELEEDGVTVPSYDEEPSGDDELRIGFRTRRARRLIQRGLLAQSDARPSSPARRSR